MSKGYYSSEREVTFSVDGGRASEYNAGMRYLALGDSISIDDYTGVPGGGAASQFARLIGATEFQNLTQDGCITDGVLEALTRVAASPDVVSLTAGGNDFLLACFYGSAWQAGPDDPEERKDLVVRPLTNLDRICRILADYRCPVILNTVYDPTDGDDRLAEFIGIPATFRRAFEALNQGIRELAAEHGFILSDLQGLFRGHGIVSPDPWIVQKIEPNYAGASAIAKHWYGLFAQIERQ